MTGRSNQGVLFPRWHRTSILTLVAILWMPIPCFANYFGSADVAKKMVVLDADTPPGAMGFSPDGLLLAMYSWGNGGTDVWDVKGKRIVHHMPEGGSAVHKGEMVLFSPDGQLLALCRWAGPPAYVSVDIYDTAKWTIVHSIRDDESVQEKGCDGIAFTPNGKELVRLAGIHHDKPGSNVLFYDTSSWQVLRRFRTEALYKASAWSTTTIKNYEVTPDTILIDANDAAVSFDASLYGVFSVSRDGQFIALSGTSMGGSQLFEHEEKDVAKRMAEIQKSTHQDIAIIDIENHRLFRAIRAGAESLDWSPDRIHVAAAGGDVENLRVFDIRSGESVATEGGDPVHGLIRYTPNGKYLIAVVGKKVEIWDGRHQTLLQTISAEPDCIAVSPNSHYFAIGGSPNSILDATALLSLITHPNGPPGKIIIFALK